MADPRELVQAFVKAQMGDTDALAMIEASLAGDVSLQAPRMRPQSAADVEAVRAVLSNQLTAANYRQATWGEPVVEGDLVRITGTMPLTAQLGGFVVSLGFDAAGKIATIEQQNLPAPPLPPSPVRLTDAMKELVRDSWRDAPMLVACVMPQGEARLSYRGSIQPYGDDKLAFWVRNTSGGTISALDTNPRLTVHYRNPQMRATFTFYGPACVTKDESERRYVYKTMCENEQISDLAMAGVAVIMEVDRIEGFGPEGRVNMVRDAGAK